MAGSHPNRRVAALLGNGVSIAFNAALALPQINAELRERLNRDVPQGDPASVLTEAANKIDTGDPYSDFEALLGPLDQQYDFIQMMAKYAAIIGQSDQSAAEALVVAADFVRDVRRTGTSFALEIIDERSRAHVDQMDGLYAFVKGMVEAADGERLTVANLNYDSLMMACFSQHYPSTFCDMARGYPRSVHEVLAGEQWLGYPLRVSADFPMNRTIRLVHLHGSLTWLRSPGGTIYRFPTECVRLYDFWEKWRNNETDWQPEVVLTNQTAKTEVVKEQPYALAYSVTEQDLIEADRWLIAGYSFRDESVNAMLARAWAARTRPPHVLVITHGHGLEHGDILRGIGSRWWQDTGMEGFLDVERGGLADALESDVWKRWAGTHEANVA